MDKPIYVYSLYIRTTPEKLWQALIDSEFMRLYWSGATIKSDWKVGSPVQLFDSAGEPADTGTVLRFEPPRVLSYSWHVSWHPVMKKERPCRVTFEIDPRPQSNTVRLTVTHDDFDPGSKVYEAIQGGWPVILSGLKSLLETGEPLFFEKFVIKDYLARLNK